MHRKISAVFWSVIAILLMTGLFEASRRFSDPYMLRIGNEAELLNNAGSAEIFEETFAVKTGTIADNLYFEETAPEGSYPVKTAAVPFTPGSLAPGAGDLVPAGRPLVRYEDGSDFSLSRNCRILSVSKDKNAKRIYIRYIPAGAFLLELKVSEQYMNLLSSNTPVSVQIGSHQLRSRIVRIADKITDQCFSVFLSVMDEEIAGRSGCGIGVCITAQEKEGVLLIPEACVYRTDPDYSDPYASTEDAFVLVKRGEDTLEIPIQTGISDGIMTEVLYGLNESDLVLAK